MKRSFLAIGFAFVGGTIVAAACAFPDVTFSAGDASTPETGTPDTGADTGADGGDDSAVAPELEASTDSGTIDAESCLADTCDCDGDKALDFNKRAICDAGTADAAAYDCDDLVAARRPGADFQTVSTPATDGGRPPAGDWNCDGKLELYYDTNLKCGGTLGCQTAASTSTKFPSGGALEGFIGDIKCGDKATLYRCVTNGITCETKEVAAERTQGCK